MDPKFMSAAQDISTRLHHIEAEYHGAALGAFLVLEKYDAETARIAVETFNDRDNAALWFSRHVGSLEGKLPWDHLAIGDVNRVQWVLNAISHGLPP